MDVKIAGALTIRAANEGDLSAIGQIQANSPGASQWKPASYLEHNCLIAEKGRNVLGFVVWRQIAQDEWEILNLAVAPSARHQGVARGLVQLALEGLGGACFLEVRESNEAAMELYKSFGFSIIGRREKYYDSPPESGIVMKFNS